MNRTQLARRTRKLHKWLGLIVAIQVLLWISGGLIMASLDLDMVRGSHYAAEQVDTPVDAAQVLVSPRELAERIGQPLASATLKTWQGQPVYQVSAGAASGLYAASTGVRLSPIDLAAARAVATDDYTGPGELVEAELLNVVPSEARSREAPLWRLRFDDAIHTAVYVSAETGRVVARRNDWWRAFDVVWMLHIMDYDTRDNFNHPLLVITAGAALLFVFSGIVLLVLSLLPRRRSLAG